MLRHALDAPVLFQKLIGDVMQHSRGRSQDHRKAAQSMALGYNKARLNSLQLL